MNPPPKLRRRPKPVRVLEVDEAGGQQHSGIPTPVHIQRFAIATDSGAHSLYKKIFSGDGKKSKEARARATYGYTDTPEFRKFLDKYIEFVHEFKAMFAFYVTLDIIGHPQKSWDITKYMESCGLHPMPVYHFGEPIAWLKKMADEYAYIGVGGMGQDITKPRFARFAKDCFKVLCDARGHPNHKIHGFALGAPQFITEYPFMTCDSSTWTYMARVGSLLVPPPRIVNGHTVGYDFLRPPHIIATTNDRIKHRRHYDNCTPQYRAYIDRYLAAAGIARFDQIRESYLWRDVMNIRWYKHMETQAKALYRERWGYGEGGNIVFAGTSSHASTDMVKLVDVLHFSGLDDWFFLGSPEYPKQISNIITIKHCVDRGIDLRHAQIPYRPRARAASLNRLVAKPGVLLNPQPRIQPATQTERLSEKERNTRPAARRLPRRPTQRGTVVKTIELGVAYQQRAQFEALRERVRTLLAGALAAEFPDADIHITDHSVENASSSGNKGNVVTIKRVS